VAGLGAGGAAGGGGPLAGLGALVAGNGLLAIAAGLIVGVVGSGTLLATGAVHFGGGTAAPVTSTAGLQLVACPDVGPVIGTIPRGEKVLVTGRSADGRWLQISYLGPAFSYAWTKAGPLRLEADANGLPIAACLAPPTPTPRPTPEASAAVEPTATPVATATPGATPAPTATPTAAPTASPTAKPTAAPTPTPTPRPTPNAAPSITGLTASTKTLSYDQGAYCPTAPKGVTFTLKASDAGGIATATLYWRKPGASSYAAATMTLAAGSAQSGTWRAALDTTANAIRTAGRLTYYAVVRDSDGAQTRSPATGTQVVAVKVCVNTGPTFTSGPSAGDSTLYADPGKVGCGGPNGTEIRATITDIDGVKSATLVFTDQAGRVAERPMVGFAGNLWTSSINANDDGTQAGGSFTWHVVAADGKGAQTTSAAQSIRVIRCDTPAIYSIPAGVPPINPTAILLNLARGVAYPLVSVIVGVTDGDGTPSVLMTWQLTDRAGTKVLLSDSVAMSRSGSLYSGTIQTSTSWWDAIGGKGGIGRLWVSFVSTDPYGGTTPYANSRAYNAYVSGY
jgi:hypothetical protein